MSYENLSNKKYGRLKVIKEVGRSKDKNVLWQCLCDCGNTSVVMAKSLRNGDSKSCGCSRKIEKGLANFNRLYHKYKSSKSAKNLGFYLSKDEFKKVVDKNCFYCGITPQQKSTRKCSNGDYLYNGIDRLDNLKGYFKENIKPCCFICNKAKGIRKYKEFVLWIKKLAKNWQKKL